MKLDGAPWLSWRPVTSHPCTTLEGTTELSGDWILTSAGYLSGFKNDYWHQASIGLGDLRNPAAFMAQVYVRQPPSDWPIQLGGIGISCAQPSEHSEGSIGVQVSFINPLRIIYYTQETSSQPTADFRLDTDIPLVLNQWYKLTVLVIGGTVRIWVDGQSVATMGLRFSYGSTVIGLYSASGDYAGNNRPGIEFRDFELYEAEWGFP